MHTAPSTNLSSLTARAVVVVSLLAPAIACQTALEAPGPPPDLVRQDTYVGGGVVFGYPGNWSLVDHVDADEAREVRTISVGLPGMGGAYMRVFSPPPPDLDFEAFKNAFAATVTDRVPSALELSSVQERSVASVVAGEEREGSRRQYNFRIFTAILRVALEFHRIDVAERSVFLVTLASGDPDATDDGFELVKRSLRVQSGEYVGGAMRGFRVGNNSEAPLDDDALLDVLLDDR